MLDLEFGQTTDQIVNDPEPECAPVFSVNVTAN